MVALDMVMVMAETDAHLHSEELPILLPLVAVAVHGMGILLVQEALVEVAMVVVTKTSEAGAV